MIKLGLWHTWCQALAATFACSMATILLADAPTSSTFVEVSEGNFVRFGQHEPISAEYLGTLANTGFIIGDHAVAVIDPGGDKAHAEAMREVISSHTDKPVSVVVFTHLHPDHMLGGSVFDDVPSVVAHEHYTSSLPVQGDHYLAQFGEDVGISSLLTPTLSVTEGATITFDLGNRPINITAHPAAHSRSDLSVLDKRTRTLWTGDLVFNTRTPSLDGSLRGWLDVLQAMARWQVDIVVPGHGESGNWLDVSGGQQRYLNDLLKTTRANITNGASLSRVVIAAEQEQSKKWKQFDLHHPINVSKAFTELEWE